jgi:4'-phosphopantetheinyl transferase
MTLRTPAAFPARGVVHLWTADLDAVAAPDDALAAHLSQEELLRADSFVFRAHRRRYLVSHAFLRSVLGDCLGRRPAAIEVGRTAHGKPVLAAGPDAALHFSLSHSGPVAACAVAREAVGVDIERERAIPEAAEVASRIFTAERLARWSAGPEPDRVLSLLVGWTQFEALAKAQGGGLVSPPAPIDLDGCTDRWQPVRDRGERWSVTAVRPAEGTVLSVAIAGGPARLSMREWRPPQL